MSTDVYERISSQIANEFESGARVLMEFTDCEPDELAVGVPLRMVFRIKEVDPLRGFRRYFWKATVVHQGKED